MRGKLVMELYKASIRRITPAHAGKTGKSCHQTDTIKDHPRACGENFPDGVAI